MTVTEYDARGMSADARYQYGGLITVHDGGGDTVRVVLQRAIADGYANSPWETVCDDTLPRQYLDAVLAGCKKI